MSTRHRGGYTEHSRRQSFSQGDLRWGSNTSGSRLDSAGVWNATSLGGPYTSTDASTNLRTTRGTLHNGRGKHQARPAAPVTNSVFRRADIPWIPPPALFSTKERQEQRMGAANSPVWNAGASSPASVDCIGTGATGPSPTHTLHYKEHFRPWPTPRELPMPSAFPLPPWLLGGTGTSSSPPNGVSATPPPPPWWSLRAKHRSGHESADLSPCSGLTENEEAEEDPTPFINEEGTRDRNTVTVPVGTQAHNKPPFGGKFPPRGVHPERGLPSVPVTLKRDSARPERPATNTIGVQAGETTAHTAVNEHGKNIRIQAHSQSANKRGAWMPHPSPRHGRPTPFSTGQGKGTVHAHEHRKLDCQQAGSEHVAQMRSNSRGAPDSGGRAGPRVNTVSMRRVASKVDCQGNRTMDVTESSSDMRQLHEELLRLEQQWRRLEELKAGFTTGEEAAAPLDVECLPPQRERSRRNYDVLAQGGTGSLAVSSASARAPPIKQQHCATGQRNHSASDGRLVSDQEEDHFHHSVSFSEPQLSSSGEDSFSAAKVLQLIRQRKSALRSSVPAGRIEEE